MSGEAGLEERRREQRLDEIYVVAQAGAWDGDPRATALVQCLRDLWDFREASLTALKDTERANADLRERIDTMARQELADIPEYVALERQNERLRQALEAIVAFESGLFANAMGGPSRSLQFAREALQEPAPQGAEAGE